MNDEIEPFEYFTDLKKKVKTLDKSVLENSKSVISQEIIQARKLGQKNFLHKVSYMWDVIDREVKLHAAGITKFVYKDDIIKFIEKVTPRNSVKCVELRYFPRAIPARCAKDIESAQSLGVFDEIIIVYTDMTDEEVRTPEQEALLARNRDPIAFGMMLNNKINLRHERLYFITDWEDEYCDLTLTKMIDKMAQYAIDDPLHDLSMDINYINNIVSEELTDIISESETATKIPPKPEETSGFWKSIMSKISGKH